MQLTLLVQRLAGIYFTTLEKPSAQPMALLSPIIAHPKNRTRSYTLNRLAINLGWPYRWRMGGILAEMDYNLSVLGRWRNLYCS